MTAGAAWKERRESLGKTVDDISSELRISPKYIEGMESGRFDGWPARVFAQGFIRSYASLLGIDPEPLLDEYAAQQGAEGGGDEPSAPSAGIPLWRAEESGRGRRSLVYGVIALVLLAAAAVVSYVARSLESVPPPSAPAVATPKPPPAAPAPAPQADNGAAAQAPTAPSAPSSVPPAVPTAAPAGEGFAPVPAAGPYHLLLEAAEETWISWSADDGKVSEATLSPGERLNIPAKTRIRLRLGNAGGVVPTLNGKRIAPFGRRGQVLGVLVGPPPAAIQAAPPKSPPAAPKAAAPGAPRAADGP